MATYAKMKGEAKSPGGSRSKNNTGTLEPKLRGKAVAPTQGITRNHPNTSTSTGKRAEIGKGIPNTFYANSRTAVHKNFDRHPHD